MDDESGESMELMEEVPLIIIFCMSSLVFLPADLCWWA